MGKPDPICQYHHLLIGLPASGKSSFANSLAQQIPTAQIISTDQIRQDLYGDPSIQGDWLEIETQALAIAQTALNTHKTIIYDATNSQRVWRLNWLQKTQSLTTQPLHWIGWFLDIPETDCLKRNKNRDRLVSPAVIHRMAIDLENFPPDEGEGLQKIITLTANEPIPDLTQTLKAIDRSIIYRTNRHNQITYHRYSHLLDFERLLFLLQNLLHQPDRQNLDQILGDRHGAIYANIDEIQQDLEWLQNNDFFHNDPDPCPLTRPELDPQKQEYLKNSHYPHHRYSDWKTCERLLLLIRGLSRHPFLGQKPENTKVSQATMLIQDLIKHKITHWEHKDAIRRDIETILKPYQFILQKFPLKQGYFIGTAILTAAELQQLREVLHSQEIYLEDPKAIALLEILDQRLTQSNIQPIPATHPIRAIGNRHKIDIELLPDFSLLKQQDRLAQAIHDGKMLQFSWLKHSARWNTANHDSFLAYPLQIIFFNGSWYLGHEKEDGLYSFSRMDRLSLLQPDTHNTRPAIAQQKAISQLERLHKATFGVHLGRDPKAQRQYLSSNSKLRQQAEVKLEIWMNDQIFSFIREGTQRFQKRQMQFSAQGDRPPQTKAEKQLFSLKSTDDKTFPHRLRLTLPNWSLQDIELKRWLIGFHSNIKIIDPPEFVEEFRKLATDLVGIYPN